MKIRILYILLASVCLWACNANSDQANTNDTQIDQIIKETIANRSTIEDFWNTFQIAVADRDIQTLETLYAPDVVKYKFSDEVYQEKIANGLVTDIKETGERYQGSKVYEFAMVLPAPPPMSEDDYFEDSQTTIYIRKNNAGLFEIFYVIEAG